MRGFQTLWLGKPCGIALGSMRARAEELMSLHGSKLHELSLRQPPASTMLPRYLIS